MFGNCHRKGSAIHRAKIFQVPVGLRVQDYVDVRALTLFHVAYCCINVAFGYNFHVPKLQHCLLAVDGRSSKLPVDVNRCQRIFWKRE